MATEVKIPRAGYELAADLYETDADEILLVLPGYTSTKAKYTHMVQAIVSGTGLSALVLDYAGHGVSPLDLDDLSRGDNFADAIAAFDWLVRKYPNKKISILGTSYGGFHAAHMTKFRQYERLILRVPASYPENEMYDVFKYMDDRHGGEYRFKKENYMDHWLFTSTDAVRGKTLLITHELDDICPLVSTMPFNDAFSADHWEAKGFKHGFGESDVTDEQIQAYYQRIIDWINQ